MRKILAIFCVVCCFIAIGVCFYGGLNKDEVVVYMQTIDLPVLIDKFNVFGDLGRDFVDENYYLYDEFVKVSEKLEVFKFADGNINDLVDRMDTAVGGLNGKGLGDNIKGIIVLLGTLGQTIVNSFYYVVLGLVGITALSFSSVSLVVFMLRFIIALIELVLGVLFIPA